MKKPIKGNVTKGRSASKGDELRRFLANAVWPTIPKKVRGKRVTKRERERILGYGPGGV